METKVETGGKEDIYSITNNLTGNSVGGGFTKAKAEEYIKSRPGGDYSIKKKVQHNPPNTP